MVVGLHAHQVGFDILTQNAANKILGLSSRIQDEAIDVAKLVLQGAHCHGDIFTCSLTGELRREHSIYGSPS